MSAPTKDLWTSARAALSREDREQLTFAGGENHSGNLSDLLELTERAKDQCIQKRWRFSRPGHKGETVVLRDLFAKLVVWINAFKEIGDVAMQYDPGHAALPWAGVRFVLQIATGDIARFDFLVAGLESIARMITRYAIFEDVYLARCSEASKELEQALISLYAVILTYLLKAKAYFEQSFLKRHLKSTLVTTRDFDNLAKKLDLELSNVDRCAAIVDAENQSNANAALMAHSLESYKIHTNLLKLLHKLDGPISRIDNQLAVMEDHQGKSERYKILRWVSSQPYLEHHEQVSKDALPGTGQWLLNHSTYHDWCESSSSSLLWLHGKVGSGKSILVSTVIEDAMRRSRAGQCPPPVYFYCSRNAAEPERSDPAAILSCIARQLSSAEPGHPILSPIVEKYETKGQGFNSNGLQLHESREMIIRLSEYYPVTTIIIDALDECNPERRADLLETLEGLLQESSLGLLKVFVSSRDDQDIVWKLQGYPNLDLVSDQNSLDIANFVSQETNRLIRVGQLLRNSRSKDALRDMIVHEVTRGADGMFRWASLQLEVLSKMKTDADILARLGRLPPKLEQLYTEIYEGSLLSYPGEIGQMIFTSVMKWLLCAQRQLASSDFCTAIAVYVDIPRDTLTKEHILDLCVNLVVYDSGLDVFRFAHLSVREFFECRTEYLASSCHLLAAETCLIQLIGSSKHPRAYPDVELQGQIAPVKESLDGFHQYASSCWTRHCVQIGDEQSSVNVRFERMFHCFLINENQTKSAFGRKSNDAFVARIQ